MCLGLSCRPNVNASYCVYSPILGSSNPPIGAAVGTTCASGKICDRGECVANSIASVGDCVLGDDIVDSQNSGLSSDLVSGFPNIQNSCDEIIKYLSAQNLFPIAYCLTNTQFASTCCKTCASIYLTNILQMRRIKNFF